MCREIFLIPNGTAGKSNLSCQIIISPSLIVTLALTTLCFYVRINCFFNTIKQMCLSKIQILTGLQSC